MPHDIEVSLGIHYDGDPRPLKQSDNYPAIVNTLAELTLEALLEDLEKKKPTTGQTAQITVAVMRLDSIAYDTAKVCRALYKQRIDSGHRLTTGSGATVKVEMWAWIYENHKELTEYCDRVLAITHSDPDGFTVDAELVREYDQP